MLATVSRKIRKIQDNVGEAALSPDGSRIVFERNQKLWQIGPNGEDPEPLFNAEYLNCWGLSWSPDGRWLTYIRKTGETDPAVVEARLPENGRTTAILKDSNLRGYIWLSTKRIVVDKWEAPDRPYSNLWQIDVDPEKMKTIGSASRLTNWAGFSIRSMSVSRDGNSLALTRGADQSNIFIGELTDQGDKLAHLHRMSPEDRVEWPGGWSPDSKTLFFQSDRTGHMNIFRENINGITADPVVIDQNDNRAPVLTPEKAWVVYFAWPRSGSYVNSAKLMRTPVEGGPSELILEVKTLATSNQTSYWVDLPTLTGQPAFRCPSL